MGNVWWMFKNVGWETFWGVKGKRATNFYERRMQEKKFFGGRRRKENMGGEIFEGSGGKQSYRLSREKNVGGEIF